MKILIRSNSHIRIIRIFVWTMTTFDKLVDLFRQFPGIGPRQAKRFVYFLLARDKEYLEGLNTLIGALKDHIVQCKECYRFFQKKNAGALCPICADLNRNTGELMVVAKDTDLEAMEKSGTYHGRYFVLGGTIPLVERENGDKLRLKELISLIEHRVHLRASASSNQRTSASLKEVILALSANPEGEHTADELRAQIRRHLMSTDIKITTLGRGLSTGSELEYADSETLKSALKNRL